MFTNSSRVFAFLKYADWRRTAIVLATAVPTASPRLRGSRWQGGDEGSKHVRYWHIAAFAAPQ
jgi:hypothetical protein